MGLGCLVALLGLFGDCSAAACYAAVTVLVGSMDACDLNDELNANSGDVNFYVVEDVGVVVAVAVGSCYGGNKMRRLMKDCLKNLRNYLN